MIVGAGRRLLLDICHVCGGAGDGLHAPESGQPVHRLGGGGHQHGLLRLRGHRPLCSRLRVQPFHGSPCIASCTYNSHFSPVTMSYYMITNYNSVHIHLQLFGDR